MITTLFFDLDGTLLPMDLENFTKAYLKTISNKMVPFGFDPKLLAHNILKSTMVMASHEPTLTNERIFWDYFASIYGESIREYRLVFEDYYENDFSLCQKFCPSNPKIPSLISLAKKLGFRIVLATNPIFPRIAVEKRIQWAGLEVEDFEWITTYENAHFSKPNPAYFLEITKQIGVKPEEVLMIGNDLKEDYAAIKAGMKVFILTDYLISDENHSLSSVDHGGVEDLKAYLVKLAQEQAT